MDTKHLLIAVACVALSACDADEARRAIPKSAGGPDPAAQSGAPPATAGFGGKIDAQQAIAAATAAVPGSAQEVKLESRGGKPSYEVTVLPKGRTMAVRVDVDAVSGKVLKSTSGKEKDDDDDD